MEAGPGLGGASLTPKGKETPIICGFGAGVRPSHPSGAVSSIFRNAAVGRADEIMNKLQPSLLRLAVSGALEGVCLMYNTAACSPFCAPVRGGRRVTHNHSFWPSCAASGVLRLSTT